MVYMRHRRFLPKKHRYQHPSMNLYFDIQEEPQTDELERMGYGQKVFDMVKGINVELGKKKMRRKMGRRSQGRRESGMRQRKKQSLPQPPFHSRSNHVSSSSCRTGRS
jgi:hypothetical protein